MTENELHCSNCGKTIESIPQHCGHDMIYNEQSNQLECYMGPACGYMKLDQILCGQCRKDKC